jgi:hypothetical protein
VDGPYALRRGGFELHRTREPTLGIGFREPFDTVLRRLDTSYIGDAWARVAQTLADIGLDPNTCQWGECHPGLLVTIDGSRREDSPIAGVGWLLTESDAGPLTHSYEFPSPWPDIDTVLARQDPPLLVLYDHYRAQRGARRGDERIQPSDTTTGLDLLLALMAEDPTDWRGRSTAGDGPWMRAANAIATSDPTALAGALIDAHRQYTPAGVKLCLEGFGTFLLQWTRHHWTPSD